jgi:hypothetical protein
LDDLFKSSKPPTDYGARIRVVSKRKGGLQAAPDETIIDVDRSNPILGNPHVLRDHRDMQERLRVIAAYERDLDCDLAERGPKTREIEKIAYRLRRGEKIALRCWCAEPPTRPQRPCHGDRIRLEVLRLARTESFTPAG